MALYQTRAPKGAPAAARVAAERGRPNKGPAAPRFSEGIPVAIDGKMPIPKKTVLVVEDDDVFRRGLVKLFEKQDCEVEDFRDAQSALDASPEIAPDMIVCDYKLPGMDGLEFLRKLRRRKIESPFVLVTAHFSPELKEEALACGAVAAVSKPVDSDGLKEIYLRIT